MRARRANSIGRRNTLIVEVLMGRGKQEMPQAVAVARRQWAADRALRPPMRSPGRPEPSRAVQRAFWALIASGLTTAEAAAEVGVSCPVGSRWFRHAGGMSPISLDEPTGRYLSFAEREEIALLNARQVGVREIARQIGRDPGTVSREIRRNAVTRGGSRNTVPWWRSGKLNRPRSVRRERSSLATRGCGSTCRTGSTGASAGPTARL